MVISLLILDPEKIKRNPKKLLTYLGYEALLQINSLKHSLSLINTYISGLISNQVLVRHYTEEGAYVYLRRLYFILRYIIELDVLNPKWQKKHKKMSDKIAQMYEKRFSTRCGYIPLSN